MYIFLQVQDTYINAENEEIRTPEDDYETIYERIEEDN